MLVSCLKFLLKTFLCLLAYRPDDVSNRSTHFLRNFKNLGQLSKFSKMNCFFSHIFSVLEFLNFSSPRVEFLIMSPLQYKKKCTVPYNMEWMEKNFAIPTSCPGTLNDNLLFQLHSQSQNHTAYC